MQRSSSTIHQKYLHTCTSWLRFMTCFSFGSGFWLGKIWETSLPLYPPYLHHHQKEALGVGWKERHKNMPWWGIMHKWVIWEIIEELHFSFKIFYKTFGLMVEQRDKKVALYKTVLSLNRQRQGDAISPIGVRWKVRTRPTYPKSR